MTARSILIVNRAASLQRIESVLPPKVLEALPARHEERLNAILDYLANALDKKKKPAPPPPVEETPPPTEEEQPPAGTGEGEPESEATEPGAEE